MSNSLFMRARALACAEQNRSHHPPCLATVYHKVEKEGRKHGAFEPVGLLNTVKNAIMQGVTIQRKVGHMLSPELSSF